MHKVNDIYILVHQLTTTCKMYCLTQKCEQLFWSKYMCTGAWITAAVIRALTLVLTRCSELGVGGEVDDGFLLCVHCTHLT